MLYERNYYNLESDFKKMTHPFIYFRGSKDADPQRVDQHKNQPLQEDFWVSQWLHGFDKLPLPTLYLKKKTPLIRR